MHRNVELLIGRLATDSKLRRRFAASPEATLRALSESGFELTEIEIEALAALGPDALHSFAEALDARLRKASLEVASLEIPSTTASATNPTEETQHQEIQQ